jgi:hypothetical protein
MVPAGLKTRINPDFIFYGVNIGSIDFQRCVTAWA